MLAATPCSFESAAIIDEKLPSYKDPERSACGEPRRGVDRRRRGSAMIEFCLAGTFIFLPILAGLATVGMSMVAATQAGSLNQTAGQMFSSGTDFTQAANQAMLWKIAGNLVTNTSGSGVVIVSEIDYTNNAYSCANQITVPFGSGGSGASLYAPGGQVGSAFTALMPMTNGQVAYTAETYYNNPQFAWLLAPAGTSSGIYVKAIF